MRGADATVWVSALDQEPITKSKRLLLTHLTDLQNTDIQYKEEERQTLLAWGKLPHLVRNGQALVRLRLDSPASFKAWVLSNSGKRLGLLPVIASNGILEFEAKVAGESSSGAQLLYEIVRP
jgi:hypothetical protein